MAPLAEVADRMRPAPRSRALQEPWFGWSIPGTSSAIHPSPGDARDAGGEGCAIVSLGEERSARKAKADLRELLGHLRADELERRRRTNHHLELCDLAGVVEGQLVDPLDLLAVDQRCEFEDRDAVTGILKLVQIAKLAAKP